MKRIIYLIAAVVAIIVLQSCCRNCFLGRYTRYKFDEAYKPDSTSRIRTDGFYSNSLDTTNPDTCLILGKDGTFIIKHKYLGTFNYGIYLVDNDTLKTFIMYPDNIFWHWAPEYNEFEIFDNGDVLRWAKRFYYGRQKIVGDCDNVYYFVPCSIEVPVNPIKYEKWIWADKKQWRQWVKDHPRPDDDDDF